VLSPLVATRAFECTRFAQANDIVVEGAVRGVNPACSRIDLRAVHHNQVGVGPTASGPIEIVGDITAPPEVLPLLEVGLDPRKL
jgi:hypothetical protein